MSATRNRFSGTHTTARRVGRAVLMVAALLSLAFSLRMSFWLPLQNEKNAWGGFGADYMAGFNAAVGIPVYDHALTIDAARGMGAPEGVPRFSDPPVTALLFAPLAVRLDAVSAFRLCLALYQVMLWLSAGLLLWAIRARLTVTRASLAVIAVSWFTPCWDALQAGRITMLILLVVSLGLFAFSRGRPFVSGGLFAVAAAVKLFPGILVLHFALRRRWRGLIAFIVVSALLFGISLAVLGPGTHWRYLRVEIPENAARLLAGSENLALNSLVYRFVHRERLDQRVPLVKAWSRHAARAARVLILLGTCLFLVWPRRDDEHTGLARLCLLLVTALMINSWTRTDHLVMALPCLAVAGRGLLEGRRSIFRPDCWLVILAYLVMAIGCRVQFNARLEGLASELARSATLNFLGLVLIWIKLVGSVVLGGRDGS